MNEGQEYNVLLGLARGRPPDHRLVDVERVLDLAIEIEIVLGRLRRRRRRSGTPELWMTDGEGGNLTQLTRLGVQSLGTPRWSPDNRHVAFFARIGTEPQIYVIDATTGQPVPQQATHEVPGCNIPTWSRSGKFVYCSRRIEGEIAGIDLTLIQFQ